MRVHLVVRKFVTYLAAFQSLVTAFPFDVDNYASVATSASSTESQNIKRQYAYVTTTVPETITYTSTIYQSVTFYMTYTRYAMRTITMNVVSVASNPLNAAEYISSTHTITVTEARTTKATATRIEEAVTPGQEAPGTAFTVTQTATQRSTITDTTQDASSLVKTSMITIFRTTLVTGPPTIITLSRTSFTTSWQEDIISTRTVGVPMKRSLLADEANSSIIPKNIATSTEFTVTGTAPVIRHLVPLTGRSVVVTVSETVTPSTSVVVTVTVTVPGVWITSTIFTGTIAITAINTAAPPVSNIGSDKPADTRTITMTQTTTALVTIISSEPASRTPQIANDAPNVVAGGTETVTVTVTDIATVPAAKTVSSTITHWVTLTALPRLSTTTQTTTITRTSVTDVIYVKYVGFTNG
ncbi:hypothetical protein UA08_05054 [Talaromyces atroroseus]|uniref:Uncharacterized protein n=1 Tax=Talaromyces atroroseus TaxID=1441469 RepID=A0A225ADU7_TALAT|nr:hypothetical protein UA08_05054 [Talaromyces atroroseus]OKL59372.1 hypothetical protein UA08_05054 [Talaromyces atroroseus]